MSELQAFYGGTPKAWLSDTPIAVLRAFYAMMPRLQARKRLEAIEDLMLASGGYSQRTAQRLFDALERKANETVDRAARPASRSPDPAALAAMGVSVRVVNPKAAEAPDG